MICVADVAGWLGLYDGLFHCKVFLWSPSVYFIFGIIAVGGQLGIVLKKVSNLLPKRH